MQEIRISFTYLEYDSPESLNGEDKILLEHAKLAAATSYSPYSKFQVGAAVLLENGEIIQGSNQENVAFPSGLCAERVAVFAASSAFPGIPVKALAITAHSIEFPVRLPVSPCGACRQVLMEYEMRDRKKIRLILHGESGKVRIIDGIETMLPLYFNEEHIGK